MSGLTQAVDEYLALRRALGFKLRQHGPLLRDFVAYLERAGAATPTSALALAWATGPAAAQPYRWSQRLGVVRGFTRWLRARDRAVQVPPADLLRHHHERPTPHLYTSAEVRALLAAAGELRPRMRAATYGTLFGLVAATGMRLGEATGLDRGDVDLGQGVLTIRQAKFGKSRALPLHPSTLAALAAYADERDRLCRLPRGPSFFVTSLGTRPCDGYVRQVFRGLARRAGLAGAGGSRPPRAHDLRHSFAVATLRDWYQADLDVAARLPLLSAYLGHVSPASTYWYLQATPELLALAAARLERVGREMG